MPKYPALRFITFLIRFFGWLMLIVGLLGVARLLAAVTGIMQGGIYLPIFAPVTFGILFFGLWFLAFGELIKVFIDIALNTAWLAPTRGAQESSRG